MNTKKNFAHHYVNQTFKNRSILNGTAVFVEKEGVFKMSGDRLIRSYGAVAPDQNTLSVQTLFNKVLVGIQETES